MTLKNILLYVLLTEHHAYKMVHRRVTHGLICRYHLCTVHIISV